MPEQQVEIREQERAGPVPEGPALATPSLAGTGARAHELAILNLQQTAGNRAVAGALRGVQRAPTLPGLQRAPGLAAGVQLNAEGRAERIRQAIDAIQVSGNLILTVKDGPVMEALEGMTEQEGREVRKVFGERTGWSLRDLIAGQLEVNGRKVIVQGLGPHNRRRIQMLLRGTVAEAAADPMKAMDDAQQFGQLIGSFVGKGDELGSVMGAVAAVQTRDRNIAQETQVGARRRTAQAIQIKGWMDKGQKDKVFALLRKISAPDQREERQALSDAYEAEFKVGLYIALTKYFKDPIEFQRVGALWDNDLTKDDRLATQAHVERVKKAERDAPKLPAGLNTKDLPEFAAKPFKDAQAKVRDAKAGLEAHLDEMRGEAAAPAADGGAAGAAGDAKSRLDAALELGTGAAGLRYDITRQTGVKVDDLFTAERRPEVIAGRLARKVKDGSIKAADVESAIRELRAVAEQDALREAREAPAKGGEPRTEEQVREAYFAQFHAEFARLSDRPLVMVLSSLGSAEDRNRNLALLVRQGGIDEVSELYFALRSKTKDMTRVRAILEPKTGPEIRELGRQYLERFGKSLGTAVMGEPEEIRRIRNPTPDDLRRGRVPKDLSKARRELDDKLLLLKGSYAFEASGSIKAGLDFVEELALVREHAGTPGATGTAGAVPVSDTAFKGLADTFTTQAEKEAVRGEANHLLSRILARETSVDANRGLYARARDRSGNIDRRIIRQTREDAIAAFAKIEEALKQDPPDLAVARGQITTMHIAEARMQHNLGVYDQRTEESFNAFVDLAVMVASTLATAGAGGIIAGAVRATAATLATKLLAKGPDYLTSPEILADLRSGVFGAVGGKLSDKVVGRFVQGWAKGIIDRTEKLGAAAGFGARAASAGAKAALYGVDTAVSNSVSGGLESAVQGKIDPLADQFTVSNVGLGLGQAGAHKVIKGARAKYGAWQEKRAQQQESRKAAASGRPAAAADAKPPTAEPTADAAEPIGDVPDAAQGATRGGPAQPTLALAEPGAPRPRPTDPAKPAPAQDAPARPTADELAARPGAEEPTARRGGVSPDAGPPPRPDLTERTVADDTDAALRQTDAPLGGVDGFGVQKRESQYLMESTGPLGGRAFAAEVAPLYRGWDQAPLHERIQRFEAFANKLLKAVGLKYVPLSRGDLKTFNAQFNEAAFWITIDEARMARNGEQAFAEVAGSLAHEMRHAVQLFRVLRVALHLNLPIDAIGAPADIVDLARQANDDPSVDKHFKPPEEGAPDGQGSPAYEEALAMYQERWGADSKDRPTIGELNTAMDAAGKKLTWAVDDLNTARKKHPEGGPEVDAAEADYKEALEQYRVAENRYQRDIHEADARRRGTAVTKAVLERLPLQAALDAELKPFADRHEAALARLREARAAAEAARAAGAADPALEAQAANAYRDEKLAKKALNEAKRKQGQEGATATAAEPAEPPPLRARAPDADDSSVGETRGPSAEPAQDDGARPIRGDGTGGPPKPPKPPKGPVNAQGQEILPGQASSDLEAFATQHDLILKVRPMNPHAVARLEGRQAPGGKQVDEPAMAKMDIVKAKTITEVDELIGAPRESLGLVGLFEPTLPRNLPADMHARAMDRYETRLAEWQNRERDYGSYIQDGIVRIEGGLLLVADPRSGGAEGSRGRFRRVAGDVDLFDVRHADGRPLSIEEMRYVESRLRSMGINVEHGALEWWSTQDPKSFAKYEDVYRGIVQEHTTDTPLVAYVPREEPRMVLAGTDITRQPRTDRPGDRVLPLRTSSVEGAPGRPVGEGGSIDIGEQVRRHANPSVLLAQGRVERARGAHAQALRRLEEAKAARASDAELASLDRQAAEAMSDVGYAEVALGEALNQAVRDMRIAEGIADRATAAASPSDRPPTRPDAAPAASDGGSRPLAGASTDATRRWVEDHPTPGVVAARRRVEAARLAYWEAMKRTAVAKASRASRPELARLDAEEATRRSDIGYAEVALAEAINQAVREKVVADTIEASRERAATAAERRNVEAIDDPELAARLFIDQRGFSGGNTGLQRGKFESEWREVHGQVGAAPAAAWRRADGTVVIDRSNKRVVAAVERLARERANGGR